MVTWTDLLRPDDALQGWVAWMGVTLVLGTVVGALLAGLLWRQTAGRRRAERRADRAQADLIPLAQAVANSGEAVVATDIQRRITWVNDAFTRMSGYRSAEVVGRSPGQVLQFEGTDPDCVRRIRQALDAGQPFTGEILNRDKAGRAYWIELRIQPTHAADGTPTGFMSFQNDVTERKRAETVLRDSQRLLDQTGRIGGVGGWVLDLATRQVQWTDQTCRLLETEPGYQPTVQDCLDTVSGRARDEMQRLLAWGVDGAAHWDVELPMRTLQGRSIWVRLVAEVEQGPLGPLRIAGALQDITQRHELKEQLLRQAELLHGAFQAVDEAFVLFDAEDRLVMCNERYRQLYDRSREVIVPGARFEDIIRHGAAAGQYEAAVGREEDWVTQRLASYRAGDRTLVQRLASGQVLRVVDRRMADGHVVGFRVDITELVRATESAERADRAKSEFIATISHELRTPLQAITGFSDLGKHFAQGHPQYETMFQDIHAAGLRMLKLVNGLLDVSKIDGTVGSLKLSRASLWPLVHEVLRELRQMARAREVSFDAGPIGDDLVADVDSFRLQQVLRNVLANALRFSPPGSVISLRGRDLGDDGVELSVQDQGPGIPDDELETVFEPFVQSSRTRDGSGGTGLGLAICRRIMGAQAGSISIESPPEGGALVRMRLPPPAPEADASPRLLRRVAPLPAADPESAPALDPA